jgi:hypothetical protein
MYNHLVSPFVVNSCHLLYSSVICKNQIHILSINNSTATCEIPLTTLINAYKQRILNGENTGQTKKKREDQEKNTYFEESRSPFVRPMGIE